MKTLACRVSKILWSLAVSKSCFQFQGSSFSLDVVCCFRVEACFLSLVSVKSVQLVYNILPQ